MKLEERYGDYVHCLSGKVREVFRDEMTGKIVAVATDRVSAFDEKVGSIPDKGKILTAISAFWSTWIDDDIMYPFPYVALVVGVKIGPPGNGSPFRSPFGSLTPQISLSPCS